MLQIVVELAGEIIDLAGEIGGEAIERARRPFVAAEAVATLLEPREALMQVTAALRRARAKEGYAAPVTTSPP